MSSKHEHEARTWLTMAESMIQRMDYGKAERALKKAVGVAPKFSEAWIALGDFLLSQNRSEEARSAYYHPAELDPALDIEPFDVKLSGKFVETDVDSTDLLLEGIQAMLGKQMYKARKRFEKATELNLEHGAAWRLLGNARVLEGDVKGAKEAHQRAGKLEPWSVKELQLDGDLSRPIDEHPVLDHTNLMIRLMMFPPDEELLPIVDKRDQLEESTYLLELFLEEDPHQQEKWREYGVILLLQQRYEDSAKAFARSMELNIDDHESDFDFAITLYRLGVNKWRYVTEAEALALVLACDSMENKSISRMFKKFFSGSRDPDYFI